MITLEDYMMGRDKIYPEELTPQLWVNAKETVAAVNVVLEAMGIPGEVRSGWRPREVNENTSNSAKNSKHITCQACDVADNDGKIKAFLHAHPEVMEKAGIWCEAPEYTKTWCHMQIVPPGSGHRWYVPYAGPPK